MTHKDAIKKIKQLRQKADDLESRFAKRRNPSKHISPRTKLPIEHPDSKAVERIHYEMGQSLAGIDAEKKYAKHDA